MPWWRTHVVVCSECKNRTLRRHRPTDERMNKWMDERTDGRRLYNKHTFIQIDRQMDGHRHTLACSKPHPKKKINKSNNNRKGHKLTEKSNIYVHTYIPILNSSTTHHVDLHLSKRTCQTYGRTYVHTYTYVYVQWITAYFMQQLPSIPKLIPIWNDKDIN